MLIRALAAKDQLTAAKWQPFVDPETWTAYLLARPDGDLGRRLLRRRPGHRARHRCSAWAGCPSWRPVRWACGVFVEFFRAVPVLMMMLFAYYVFLFGFQISGELLPLFGVVAGLTFYNSSVIAELIRSGVGSLPSGQREAGLAIGLTPFQTLRRSCCPRPSRLCCRRSSASSW